MRPFPQDFYLQLFHSEHLIPEITVPLKKNGPLKGQIFFALFYILLLGSGHQSRPSNSPYHVFRRSVYPYAKNMVVAGFSETSTMITSKKTVISAVTRVRSWTLGFLRLVCGYWNLSMDRFHPLRDLTDFYTRSPRYMRVPRMRSTNSDLLLGRSRQEGRSVGLRGDKGKLCSIYESWPYVTPFL